jgi:hypothetical protein
LVALLAERDDWRLLMVPAKRARVDLPSFKASTVEVVPAEDGYNLNTDFL